MIKLPIERRWKTDYSSDIFGSIVASQNIDFDYEGLLTLAQKPVSIYNQDDDADFGNLIAVFYYVSPSYGESYILVTDDKVFSLDLRNGPSVAVIASSPTLDTFGDGLVFNDLTIVNDSDGVNSWDGNAWVLDVIPSYTNASVYHPMCVFQARLLLGDGNLVKAYDTSYSIQVTCTLPTEFEVTSIRYKGNNVYIGTRNINGGEARMFVWNGSGTAAQAEYPAGGSYIYSLVPYADTICAVVSTGQILRFTGDSLAPLKNAYGVEANFPVWYEKEYWQQDSAGSITARVRDRGTIVDGDLLYININSSVISNESDTLLQNFPSGIWCFDPKVGLYHKALPTADRVQNVAVSSVSSSVLTLASAVQVQTGEPVFLEAIGSLTGVTVNYTYYAIKVTTTTIKLALTPADANEGTSITIGGSAGAATITVARNNQIGSVNISRSGAIGLVVPADISDTFYSSNIIWGSRVYKTTDVDATFDTLNILSNAANVGYFITPKIYASEIEDTWQHLVTMFRELDLDLNSIYIKYRTRSRFGLPTQAAMGTYSSSTALGSNSAYFGQIEDGDEVVITKGYGAGRSSHITEINGAEISLTEAIPNVAVTNEVEFYVTDFKYLGSITNAIETFNSSYAKHALEKADSWIQFKFELRGIKTTVDQALIGNTASKAV